MRRRLAIMVAAALTVACGRDPARSVKIANATAFVAAPTAATSASSTRRTMLEWSPAMCQPTLEPPGPSSVVGAGACGFEQRGGANCALTDDDLLMHATHPMADDGLFVMYVSVENFQRPSTWDHVRVLVGVENARGLFRWVTDDAHVTVGPGQHFVKINDARLTPVPPLKAQDVFVSGIFTCAVTVEAPDAR